ncbi:MAG: DNA polymerase III subunit delta [Bowdeniella nasicola]|nr:DNA polymerase III subunit delta [Bowdeniella nasicola]
MAKRAKGKARSWQEAKLAPIVLVHGKEQVLAERAIESVTNQARHTAPDVEIIDLEAPAYAPMQLLTLTSPSLFGEVRLIRIANAHQLNDALLGDLLAYADAPADDCWMIVHHGGGMRGKKLLDKLKTTAEVIECPEIKYDNQKIDFVHADFARAKRTISKDAVQALVQAVGSDVAELAAAAAQLISDTTGKVTIGDVRRYYGSRVEATVFHVAEATVRGELATALTLARHAQETGASPVAIMGALAAKLRNLIKVGVMVTRKMSASELKLNPWVAKKTRGDLRGWTPEALAEALAAVAAGDEGVKGRAKDPHYALEKTIIAVAAARNSAGRRSR